jgi:hypothetical protein
MVDFKILETGLIRAYVDQYPTGNKTDKNIYFEHVLYKQTE